MYEKYSSIEDAGIGDGSTAIVADGGEPRCVELPSTLDSLGVSIVVATGNHAPGELLDTARVEGPSIDARVLPLRDVADIAAWLNRLARPIYLDISCLPHAIWAAIIRSAVLERVDLSVCYVEPVSYEPVSATAAGAEFDLSLSIGGQGPLPGFSRLTAQRREESVVLLLGFEGARVGHMAAALGIEDGQVRAVVGDPGMRDEYADVAIAGNRQALERLGLEVPEGLDRCGAADAIGLVRLLQSMASTLPAGSMTIVPLGPRPQALGAILFYLRQEAVGLPTPRLLYDHALRDPSGSTGVGTFHLYDLAAFTREFCVG
ncbi:MAG: hypothetical protein GY788_02405 [bacterium]|nr:hypothetical protein [bacterium]